MLYTEDALDVQDVIDFNYQFPNHDLVEPVLSLGNPMVSKYLFLLKYFPEIGAELSDLVESMLHDLIFVSRLTRKLTGKPASTLDTEEKLRFDLALSRFKRGSLTLDIKLLRQIMEINN